MAEMWINGERAHVVKTETQLQNGGFVTQVTYKVPARYPSWMKVVLCDDSHS